MKTAKEWIEAFDRGDEIDSVSMGGMGDGYEAAIQSCTIEIVRRLSEIDVPKDDNEFKIIINRAQDQAVKILDGLHGFSGAQVGAATNLASIIWRRGLDSFKEVQDRVIKIKKSEVPYRVLVA